MISGKKALTCAETLVKFCKEQPGCQNCIFRKFGADRWGCDIAAYDLREVLANIEGGLSDIVDGSYTIGLRFDLPKNTDSLALRPLGAQDASSDIPLK